MSSNTRQILVFLALATFLSLPADILAAHMHSMNAMTSRLLMASPSFAALLTCCIFQIDRKSLGWRWPERRWLLISFWLPALSVLPIYLAVWVAISGSFNFHSFADDTARSYNLGQWPLLGTFGVGLPLLATIGILSSAVWALGEELGWRGFLFPRLAQGVGFTKASFLSGLIWAAWHFPSMVWGDYNAGTNPSFALVCFTLGILGFSFAIGWLRLRSKSVWPCVLLHASHNLFVQGIFDPITASVGRAHYITTEFGIGAPVVGAVIGVYFWSRRRELGTEAVDR